MSLKKFVTYMMILVFLFVILSVVCTIASTSIDTLIGNYLAVGQLENNDEAWMEMNLYMNVVRPLISSLFVTISSILFVGCIFLTIKYFKESRTEKDEKNY